MAATLRLFGASSSGAAQPSSTSGSSSRKSASNRTSATPATTTRPYSSSPTGKESPGGLRDPQLDQPCSGFGTHWRDPGTMAHHPEEATELRELERFLQHVRIRLHHLTGCREGPPAVDHQETGPRLFGF